MDLISKINSFMVKSPPLVKEGSGATAVKPAQFSQETQQGANPFAQYAIPLETGFNGVQSSNFYGQNATLGARLNLSF